MTGFILFVVGVVANLLVIILKKKSNILACLHIAYSWLVCVFSYDVVDYDNYSNNYAMLGVGKMELSDTLEPGYYFLGKIVSMMGFDYQILRGIMFTIIIFLLVASAKKMKANPNYICVVYSVYPLFMEMIQIRNAFAMAILTFGLCFFLYEEKKMLYLLTVLFASSFHISFLIYLIFLLDGTVMKKKYFREVFVIVVIVASGLFYIGGKEVPYLNTIVSLFDNSDKVNIWLSSSGNFGFVAYGFLIVMAILITYIASVNISNGSFTNFMYRINLLSLVFIPLFMLASTFARLASNLCFVNYISWEETMKCNKKNDRIGIISLRQLLIVLLTIVYLMIWIKLELSVEFDKRVLLFFENNYFFDLFRS